MRANHKLGEAKHFLGEMREFDGASRLDRPEVFGYKFSAFLSAALSIEFVLPREVDRTAYKAERAAWHSSLSPDSRHTVDLFEATRHEAVHEGFTPERQTVEMVDWWSLTPQSRPFTIAGRAAPIYFEGEARIGVARYMIDIDGNEVSAVDIAHSYLEALTELVQRCESLPPNTTKQATGPRRRGKTK